MPGYVIGNFLIYALINAFTPGPGNILIATSCWIAAGMAVQKVYLRHYRPINIILAMTLLECVYSMLK